MTCTGGLASLPFLEHLFDNVTHLWPGHVFAACTVGSFLLAWVMVPVVPCLFVLARRKLEREP